MKLPETEKELRIIAVSVVENFLAQLPPESIHPIAEHLPIYSLHDLKAMGVWIARQAIRTLCPHITDGDKDLTDEFPEGEDKSLSELG